MNWGGMDSRAGILLQIANHPSAPYILCLDSQHAWPPHCMEYNSISIRQGAVLKKHAVQETQEEDENGFRRRERFVGKWERRFQLPENVSPALMLPPCSLRLP